MDPVPDEIIRHYEASDEAGRLGDRLRALERLRTQELIERHLPGSPGRILDVGGATGVYAQWLADQGHDVLLIDVVPSHVEVAQRLRSDAGRIDAQLGDAPALPVEDDAFDHALVLGPLYHLTERDDRVLALREARRVVKPGGLVFAAVILRFASLFDGLARQRIFDDAFAAMVERDLVDGRPVRIGDITCVWPKGLAKLVDAEGLSRRCYLRVHRSPPGGELAAGVMAGATVQVVSAHLAVCVTEARCVGPFDAALATRRDRSPSRDNCGARSRRSSGRQRREWSFESPCPLHGS